MKTIAAFSIAIAALTALPALARWKPEYGAQPLHVQQWFKTQINAKGQWCCDKSDGHAFYGQYDINGDGSVTLHLPDGQTRNLPAYMVLKGPNPTGHAVWWYLDVGSFHKDYCFSPGTLI
jgi:hypothetical protein